uniref:Uncharacterized protein n=1 Tax=Lygus hesperus TaxID=30085 RepID=A0A146ME26_LYGHE
MSSSSGSMFANPYQASFARTATSLGQQHPPVRGLFAGATGTGQVQMHTRRHAPQYAIPNYFGSVSNVPTHSTFTTNIAATTTNTAMESNNNGNNNNNSNTILNNYSSINSRDAYSNTVNTGMVSKSKNASI